MDLQLNLFYLNIILHRILKFDSLNLSIRVDVCSVYYHIFLYSFGVIPSIFLKTLEK